MKRLILLAALLVCISASGQTLLPISGYCNQGGVSAVTSGQSSQNFLQGVVPSCTVTVFASGTQNKVTIYANAQGATLGNPFTANNAGSSNPGFWVFYVPIDSLVDVQLSGGFLPTCTNLQLSYQEEHQEAAGSPARRPAERMRSARELRRSARAISRSPRATPPLRTR